MPKTYESSKVTVADFFKYLDISVCGKNPTIYWLHNYGFPPELKNALSFSFDSIIKEIEVAIGTEKVLTTKSKESEESFDATMSRISNIVQIYMTSQKSALPFDIERTARSFRVPFISTSLLDILEASILDPKLSSDARTLKGYSLELGLLDFLNTPWSDYVMAIAHPGKATFEDASAILKAGEIVGHPSREIEELYVSPKKLLFDPKDGIEALEQKNLVIVEEHETFKCTPQGREYVKEIYRKPKESALRKALDWISGRVSLNIPFLSFGSFKKK